MGILIKIRQMPDNQKKIFSLIAASVITLVIVVVWFSVGESSQENKTAAAGETKLSSLSPMQVIKDEFSKAFSNYKQVTTDLNISSSSEALTITSTSTELQIGTSTASTTISTHSTSSGQANQEIIN